MSAPLPYAQESDARYFRLQKRKLIVRNREGVHLRSQVVPQEDLERVAYRMADGFWNGMASAVRMLEREVPPDACVKNACPIFSDPTLMDRCERAAWLMGTGEALLHAEDTSYSPSDGSYPTAGIYALTMCQQEFSQIFVRADAALRHEIFQAHATIGIGARYWHIATSGSAAAAVVAWQLHQRGYRIVMPLASEDMHLAIDQFAYDPIAERGLCVQVKSRRWEQHSWAAFGPQIAKPDEAEQCFITGVERFNNTFGTKWPALLVTVASDTDLLEPKAATEVDDALTHVLGPR